MKKVEDFSDTILVFVKKEIRLLVEEEIRCFMQYDGYIDKELKNFYSLDHLF